MKTLPFLLLIFLVAFPSCEGDQGPVGPEGPDGPEGTPGSGIGYTNDPQVGFGWGHSFVEATSVTFEITETSTVFFLATENV